MLDLLRAAKTLPGFLDAARISLVEISPTLAEQQRTKLNHHRSQIEWVKDFDDIPKRPTIAIANELLDALPFKQWIKMEQTWLERGVGIVDRDIGYVTLPSVIDTSLLPSGHENQMTGSIYETSPAREAIVTKLKKTNELSNWMVASAGRPANDSGSAQ